MIGTSLSFCVKEIAKGVVDINDVEKIVAGTRASNQEEWAEIFSRYNSVYWKGLPEAESIARQLIDSGRVVQPRLTDPCKVHSVSELWVSSFEEIKWFNDGYEN